MAEKLLPPLVLELRARAGELLATEKEVKEATREMAASTEKSEAQQAAAMERTNAKRKAMAVGVLGLAGVVGVESLKMATDFQQHMTLLETAGGELPKNMGVVSSGIKTIAVDTGTNLDQLSEGMYTVEKAGLRGADGLKVLRAAAEGAKAENVDLGTATNALTSIMMSYHLKASDAVSVENQLVAASGAAKTSMEEYAGSLSSVLPTASAAGISFAQVAGAVATLTQHGTSAHEATQELANTIRGLQAPSQVAQKAMQQLGIDVTDVSSHLGQRGLTGTVNLITEALAKHSKGGMVALGIWKQAAQAQADLNTMMNHASTPLRGLTQQYMDGKISIFQYRKEVKGLGGENVLLGQQMSKLYAQSHGFSDALKTGQPTVVTFAGALNKIMGGATGMNTALMLSGESAKFFKDKTAEVAKAGEGAGAHISTWAKTQQNLSVQLDQAKQMIDVLLVNIGTKLIPVVRDVVGWFVHHKDVTMVLAGVIGGVMVLALGRYVARLAWSAAETVGKLATMVGSWMGLGTSVTAAATEVGAAEDAMAASGEAAGAATETAFGPIGLAIAAVGLAIGLLATHWQQVWGVIKSVAISVWNGFLKPVFTAIVDYGIHPVVEAAKVFAAIWAGIFHVVADVVSVAWSILKPIFGVIIALAIAPLVLATQALLAAWQVVWSGIEDAISFAWDNVISPIWDLWKAEFKVVGSILSTVGHGIGAVFRWIGDIVSTVWHTAIAPVYNFIKQGIEDVASVISRVTGAIGRAWHTFWGSLSSTVSNVVGGIKSLISGIWDGLVDGFRSAVNGIIDAVNSYFIGPINSAIDVANEVPFVDISHIPDIPHIARGGMTLGETLAVVGDNPSGNELVLPLDSPRTVSALSQALTQASPAASPQGAPHGGGGHHGEGCTHIYVQGSVVDVDGVWKAAQKGALRHGGRNSQTYQPYKRS
ncbi:MAG: phage tail tape measure protein [Jatrophihabitans sp.]|uniref:phage tail tape measure protein n=1 Tax=Jatrophihabitans sp. TaxID=1932789 RepID=UPI003F80ACFF